MSLATIVATGADGSRRVAISDDRGFYCIETEDVDVQVEVYFVDVAVLQQVHLGDEWPAAIDLLVDAYPASVEIETRYKDPDWCVIPVTPKIFDLSTR